METGARRPLLRDVRDLCSIYSLDEKASDGGMQLAREARAPAWWSKYNEIDLVPYIGLEQEASSITAYDLHYVPGLLQTEDYARALVQAIHPRIEQGVLEQRVQTRLRRQQRLVGDNPPRHRALMDEAAFHRKVGSDALMVAQVDKVLSLARDGKAVVQLVPFDRGAYPAADIMFVLLEFAQLPPIVFVEGLVESQHYDRRTRLSGIARPLSASVIRRSAPGTCIASRRSARDMTPGAGYSSRNGSPNALTAAYQIVVR